MEGWIDKMRRRGFRDRHVDRPVPDALPPHFGQEQKELLRRWVRSDAVRRKRDVLFGEVGPAGIESAEALCETLLTEGWIIRHERLVGGAWVWEALSWRDLARLQSILGVAGKRERDDLRRAQLEGMEQWLRIRNDSDNPAAIDPDLQDELSNALQKLQGDTGLRSDVLATRIELLTAIARWHDGQSEGSRRDFALFAAGGTKGISAANWHWLEEVFDLERLRIDRFTPIAWLAGDCSLAWGDRRVDLHSLHCAGLTLSDLQDVGCVGKPSKWWLIENRASFERQARKREPGVLVAWLPGRPSHSWLSTIGHLLDLAPAPARISADVDPAGVDIACTAGRLWDVRGLRWEPYRMGVAELEATDQQWPLNAHDRTLLAALMSRNDLPEGLQELCAAMSHLGRKAEQEKWI